ncbi:hypothetical protein QBC37DRAFT_2800 [Rhypophila decipiens]|uniref:Uncharacterized protein n=1 Tax=Rhypophila decipiens TaxID=261697 RepID=A0AAN7BDU5_9PEZI|nr:hypothetical protein QBC37DRAFT_2800 [Rhypophila decipiens]
MKNMGYGNGLVRALVFHLFSWALWIGGFLLNKRARFLVAAHVFDCSFLVVLFSLFHLNSSQQSFCFYCFCLFLFEFIRFAISGLDSIKGWIGIGWLGGLACNWMNETNPRLFTLSSAAT